MFAPRITVATGLLVAVLMGGPALAASDRFSGKWDDNANQGLRIGALDVTAASVGVGRRAAYRVKTLRDEGSGAILQVTGSDRRPDPFGCGPAGRVTYLVLEPLPPLPGTAQQAIRLIFYAGDHVPDPRTIDADPAVCAVHPYGRLPPRVAPAGRYRTR